jgi:hypothetical protein
MPSDLGRDSSPSTPEHQTAQKKGDSGDPASPRPPSAGTGSTAPELAKARAELTAVQVELKAAREKEVEATTKLKYAEEAADAKVDEAVRGCFPACSHLIELWVWLWVCVPACQLACLPCLLG